MANSSFIIGDAGGNGTQWRIVEESSVHEVQTIGFNPYTHNIEDFKTSIKQNFGLFLDLDYPVYVYAAGIATSEQKEYVEKELSIVFKKKVIAENDLLAVARGLCGGSAGIACILGTGSNACFYDGAEMNSVSASMGYVLGDEGSGADLGKKLLAKIFRGHFSKELIDEFQEEFKLSAHEVIEKIYNQPKPNQFLSSFAPFIYERRQNPEMNQLIQDALSGFFKGFFPKGEFNEYPMHFSGSIAYYYSDILRSLGKKYGFLIDKIVQSPISGLVSYHKTYG